MKRRYAKVGLWVAFVACLAWWVVFEVWLPKRVEITIREYFEEMEVEIEDVDGQMWHVFVNNGAPSDGTHTATFGGTTHTWTGNAAVRPVR